ncbi:MAG: 3-deoxy-D-manno-octulosonic acid transferase [Fidelibacterota bacterium]
MTFYWLLFYNLVLYPLLFVVVSVLSIFDKKLREGLKGRLDAVNVLSSFFSNSTNGKKVFWFHVSSLGEFYQVAPILKKLKTENPEIINIVSFSSPSGFNYAQNDLFHLKFYLPFDFMWTNKKIFKIISPDKIIFASYDIWPNLIWLAHKNNIKTVLFSLRIISKSIKFKPVIRSFYKMMYNQITSIYTNTDQDKVMLESLLEGSTVKPFIHCLGNPRYDYVYKAFEKISFEEEIKSYSTREKKIIVGSAHSEDDKVLIHVLAKILRKFPEWKIIYAPHDPTDKQIEAIQSGFKKNGFEPVVHHPKKTVLPLNDVVIIGSIGVLAKLYWQSKLTYIGGGFSKGIHNVMEPAIAELPVIFGPRYSSAPEADELILEGGGFCIKNSIELFELLEQLIQDETLLIKASEQAKKVIHNNLGSTKKITESILNG